MANKIDALLKKCEEHIKNDRFYEAEQLYKTLYYRLHSQKKYDELHTVLFTGTKTLLSAKRWNEATELGNMLISSYTENHNKPTKETIEPLLELFSKYSHESAEAQLASESFMKNAIKWSIAEGTSKFGEPLLHYAFAESYLKMGEYGKAQKHYLRSENPSRFAQVLYNWSQSAYASEGDLFIARAVLQYLCYGNLRDANILYQEYLKLYPTLPQSPLINYLKFLLLTLERDAFPLFEVIRKKYRVSIERDPSFQQYLDTIAQVFYKAKPNSNANPFGNIIGDLMKSLFNPQQQQQQRS